MARLIDCDERNSFLFFFRCQPSSHAYQGRNLSKKVRRGSKSCHLNPSLKPWKCSFARRSFTNEPVVPAMRWEVCWSSKPRFLLVVYLDLIVCLLAPDGGQAKMPDIQRIYRPADQRRMLCNQLLCPLKEAFSQNSQHRFSSFLSALWDKCQRSIISAHSPSYQSTCDQAVFVKRKNKRRWAGPISPQNVVIASETSGVLACHPKPGLFSNLSIKPTLLSLGTLLILVRHCRIYSFTPLCLSWDSELIYPPYRAQIDKCQGGEPWRDNPACVKRCFIKA